MGNTWLHERSADLVQHVVEQYTGNKATALACRRKFAKAHNGFQKLQDTLTLLQVPFHRYIAVLVRDCINTDTPVESLMLRLFQDGTVNRFLALMDDVERYVPNSYDKEEFLRSLTKPVKRTTDIVQDWLLSHRYVKSHLGGMPYDLFVLSHMHLLSPTYLAMCPVVQDNAGALTEATRKQIEEALHVLEANVTTARQLFAVIAVESFNY
jgi:hypothetical protein